MSSFYLEMHVSFSEVSFSQLHNGQHECSFYTFCTDCMFTGVVCSLPTCISVSCYQFWHWLWRE